MEQTWKAPYTSMSTASGYAVFQCFVFFWSHRDCSSSGRSSHTIDMDSGDDNPMKGSNGREQQSRRQTSRSEPLYFPTEKTCADKSIITIDGS